MRKHRNWFMGLGIGIILGACMLQLVSFAETQNNAMKAAEQGKTYTRQQLDEEIAKAVEEARKQSSPPASAAAPSSSADKKPQESATSQPGNKPEPSASASATPEAQSEPDVAFYINKGMDLKTVARSLRKLGVIEDANDFTEEARSIQHKVEVGTSRFKGKMTYEQVIAELTRPKDD